MPPVAEVAQKFSISCVEEPDYKTLKEIQSYLRKRVPVAIKIHDCPEKLNVHMSSELFSNNNGDTKLMFRSFCENENLPKESVYNYKVSELDQSKEPESANLWRGLCAALNINVLKSTYLVAHCVRRTKTEWIDETTTFQPTSHAVLHTCTYGSACHKYKFFLKDCKYPSYTATIGRLHESNCVLIPPDIRYEITVTGSNPDHSCIQYVPRSEESLFECKERDIFSKDISIETLKKHDCDFFNRLKNENDDKVYNVWVGSPAFENLKKQGIATLSAAKYETDTKQFYLGFSAEIVFSKEFPVVTNPFPEEPTPEVVVSSSFPDFLTMYLKGSKKESDSTYEGIVTLKNSNISGWWMERTKSQIVFSHISIYVENTGKLSNMMVQPKLLTNDGINANYIKEANPEIWEHIDTINDEEDLRFIFENDRQQQLTFSLSDSK